MELKSKSYCGYVVYSNGDVYSKDLKRKLTKIKNKRGDSVQLYIGKRRQQIRMDSLLEKLFGKEPRKKYKELQGYKIYPSGKIVSKFTEKIVKPYLSNGRERVVLRIDGFRKQMFVHRVVAQVYLKDWDPNLQVNHIDGNKRNNHIRNLEMMTQKENIEHFLMMKKRYAHRRIVDNTGKIYDTITEASKLCKIDKNHVSRRCARNLEENPKPKSMWIDFKYVEKWDGKPWKIHFNGGSSIPCKDNKGNVFNSLKQAAEFHKMSEITMKNGFRTDFKGPSFDHKNLKMELVDPTDNIEERLRPFIIFEKPKEIEKKEFKSKVRKIVDNTGRVFKTAKDAGIFHGITGYQVKRYCDNLGIGSQHYFDFKYFDEWGAKPFEVRWGERAIIHEPTGEIFPTGSYAAKKFGMKNKTLLTYLSKGKKPFGLRKLFDKESKCQK